MSEAATNLPEYSVSEISGAVKRTLEGAFGRVRVRGEITEFKRYPSGHLYFSLKDESAKISGIVWKSGVARLGLQPENGVEVIATGRITTYGERSSYQLIVERMEYAGAGALLARIERLRLKLAGEGLFDEGRKRKLPLLPELVGVITSPAGAVLHDIRTTMGRRFPRPMLLWPVPVQGEGAAARIAAAIAGMGRVVPRPDVLIVARGGGSLEDLMAFNDEAVLRAAAACPIPLISAVGHETDHTLLDLVADRRAPTPTAAAELAVPSRVELASQIMRDGARLGSALMRQVGEQRLRLGRAERGLPDLPSLVGGARQRLDDRGERLGLALPGLLQGRRHGLARLQLDAALRQAVAAYRRLASAPMARLSPSMLSAALREARGRLLRAERGLPDMTALIGGGRQRLDDRGERLLLALPGLLLARRNDLAVLQLDPALRHAVAGHRRRASVPLARLSPAMLAAGLREARLRLGAASGRLDGGSYEHVLRRGFALVTDAGGHALTSRAEVAPGARLLIRFADGTAGATADGRKAPAGQGALPL